MTELNSTANTTAHQAFDATMNKTKESLRPVVDHLMAGVHEAVERLADVASQAADKVELSGEYLKASQTRMVGNCRGYVREKPLASVGMAVAAGFLLSWALRQR
jgi:ElaB/YqjD/DUF883 family membrane-anchored ribosome-binding protein